MATMENMRLPRVALADHQIVDSLAIISSPSRFAQSYDPNDVSSAVNRYWRVVQVDIEDKSNVRLVHQLTDNSQWLDGPLEITVTFDNLKKCDLARRLLVGKVVFYKVIDRTIAGKLVLGQTTWDRPL